MTNKIFITGTDTDAGKTIITCTLLEAFKLQNINAVGLKPLASGTHSTIDGPRNEDGILLQQYSATKNLAYEIHNPINYSEAISPHLAAQHENKKLSVNHIIEACQPMFASDAELILIEGVGGWQVPLNNNETMEDLVKALACPVILVVGMRLGCLNHALLTYNAIISAGLPVLGWVANTPSPDKMLAKDENIQTLTHWIKAPCLGVIEYHDAHDPKAIANSLKVEAIIKNSIAPAHQEC